MFEFAGLVLLGLITGLIVNYLADVLPIKRTLSRPVCLRCYEPYSWRDYITASKCKKCHSAFSPRWWVILILFTGIPLLFKLLPSDRFDIWVGLLILGYLGVIFIIDLEHRAVLLPTIYAGALLFLVIGIILHGVWRTLLGAAAGYLIMLALHYVGQLFSQWLARRRGQELDEPALGLGDVNFAGVMGLVLGWPGIIAGLVLAILLGGLFSAIYLLISLLTRRYHLFLAIPYAPFMVLAVIFLLFR